MTAKPLLWSQPVTDKGDRPSRELVEVIQRLVADVEAMSAKLAAIAALSDASGGATVDAEARAAIAAILDAAG